MFGHAAIDLQLDLPSVPKELVGRHAPTRNRLNAVRHETNLPMRSSVLLQEHYDARRQNPGAFEQRDPRS